MWVVLQVYIDDNKEIDTTNVPTCTCERGQFRCHHMAVAMLHAYKSVSSTDQTCIWSRPKSTTADTLRTVSDMYPNVKPTATLDRPVCDDDRSDFLQSLLQENRQSAMTGFLSAEPTESTTAVPFVYEILYSTLWRQYRSGRLTASMFGPVLKCIAGHRKPPPSLLKQLMGEYNAAGAKACAVGNTTWRNSRGEIPVITWHFGKPFWSVAAWTRILWWISYAAGDNILPVCIVLDGTMLLFLVWILFWQPIKWR